MDLENYFEFRGADSIRIKGHRIEVEHIIELYHEGFSPEAIAHDLPSLSLETIYATITYYLHNQAPIDQYIMHRRTEAERLSQAHIKQASSPVIKRLRELQQQQTPHS